MYSHSEDADNPSAILRLNQRSMAVEKAELGIWITTESWREQKTWFGSRRGKWCYGENDLNADWRIDIVVDENSGEDGEPAPSLSFKILPEHPFPSTLKELNGMQLQDKENKLSEGWYGNDAQSLDGNSLSFGRWLDRDRLVLSWSAEYDDWDSEPKQRTSMLFHGPIEFTGIHMQVKRDEDAARFLLKALPTLDPRGLELTWGSWQDLGQGLPADRRKWHEVTWKMKLDS
jgi:hypothetical protein